ncbi:hypothetical protein MRX96_052915, partial [Rhipicephalus microplus]
EECICFETRCPAETPRPTARRQGALCPDSHIQCSGAGRLLGGGAAASADQERQETRRDG